MCIFSRSPLTEVYFHKFTLNGFPHKITHADWWGGKGMAVCKSTRHGIPFVLATTHLLGVYHNTCKGLTAHLCKCSRGMQNDEERPIEDVLGFGIEIRGRVF
ncbi:neutral sphingomyelinase-like, partial [Homarus americanus]